MQASLEMVMGLWGGSLTHGTLLVHTVGWHEGGLTFGYEKFINDIESLQIFAELCMRPEAGAAERLMPYIVKATADGGAPPLDSPKPSKNRET